MGYNMKTTLRCFNIKKGIYSLVSHILMVDDSMETIHGPGNRLIRRRIMKMNPDLAKELDNLWILASKKIHEFQEGKTEQGTLHCLRVENNIGLLLQDKIAQFKDIDLFILSATAALHDIGRIKMAKGEEEKDHGLLGQEVLLSRGVWTEFSFNWNKMQAIAYVISVHDNGKIHDLPESEFSIGAPPGVFLRSLAAIFRLADMLDVTSERAPVIMRKVRSMKYLESPGTWLSRGAIGGWKIMPDCKTILLQASFKNEDEKRAATTCVDLLNESMSESHRRYLENCPVIFWSRGSIKSGTVHFPFIFQIEGIELAREGDLSRLYQTALKEYFTHMAWDLSNVNLDGMGEFQDKQAMDLTKIFIDVHTKLSLVWRPKDFSLFNQPEDSRSVDSKTMKSSLPIVSELEHGSVPITKVINDKNLTHVVVLGDPGSGKSTIAQFVCLDAAKRFLSTEKIALIPLRVIVRNYVSEKLKRLGNYELVDYLHDEVSSHLRGKCPRGFVEYCLSLENTIVIFDGLDEVPKLEDRERMRNEVTSFTGRFNKARHILTSRIAGYEQASLDMNRFLHVQLEPLEALQVNVFVENWYQEREHDPERRKTRTDSFQKALESPAVGQLARNPLLLTIMLLVHRAEADLPRQRALLYEKCVEAFLINRDRARGLLSYDEVEIRRCHEYLGYWMHSKGKKENEQITVGLSELKSKLAEFMSSKSVLPLSLHEKKVDEFVDTARRRVGLLVEKSHGVFAFGHRSFQEYFAASFLTSTNYGIDELWASICDRVFDPYWHEVILLLAGRLGFTSHRGLNDLIEKLLETEPKNKSLILAAETANDKAPIEGQFLKRIIDEAIESLLYERISSDELTESSLRETLRKEKMKADFVSRTDTELYKYLVLLSGLMDTEAKDYIISQATNIGWTKRCSERVSRISQLDEQGYFSTENARALVSALVIGISKERPRLQYAK